MKLPRNTDLASAIYYSVDHGAGIAVQVKDIIVRFVAKRKVLTDKCISGGVLNA
jgi:hypothetical protein